MLLPMMSPTFRFRHASRSTILAILAFWTAFALVTLPVIAWATDDPNTEVTTGIPIVDVVLKVLGAVYVLLSTILLLVPKASKFAAALAPIVADLKGVTKHQAAVKEAVTGDMAAELKRAKTIPPPSNFGGDTRGFVRVSTLLAFVFTGAACALLTMAFGVFSSGCHSSQAKTACDAIRIADDACEAFVMVPLPDGTKERVPRAEIVRMATAQKAFRIQSGGAP